MLILTDVALTLGSKELFSGVTVSVRDRDRLGLVGPNGAGKSSLFKMLLGELEPDSGTVAWEREARRGFLPQESAPIGDETVLDITLGRDGHDPAAPVEGIVDHARVARAHRLLSGLGFKPGDEERPARTFSGGWVMRARLARLLLEEPEVLMLDEPTNHLDLPALDWLQEHLRGYRGCLVVISHDRAFLNAICTGILELRGGRLRRWTGNYDDFLVQREAARVQQEAAWAQHQREVAHLQKFVDRFGAKASLASRAKSKEKQIARLEEDAPEAPEQASAKIAFTFPPPPRSGRLVVSLRDVTQAYGEKVVYHGLNFEAERGRRIVLVGPNGAGKSTLLKILAGLLPLRHGTRELGLNVRSGYVAQNRLDTLDPRRSVLNEALTVRETNSSITEQIVRAALGAFLFRGDEVHKPVSVLSGGEKSRLALVKLLLDPPNLLLLDEPTTHLDMDSIDALTAALQTYPGTLVFISHDVAFIRAVAKEVLHIDHGVLTPYAGDYDYYLLKSRATDARSATIASGAAPAAAPARQADANAATRDKRKAELARREQKRDWERNIARLEEKIQALEARQEALVAKLADPAVHADGARTREVGAELEQVVRDLAETTAEWEASYST